MFKIQLSWCKQGNWEDTVYHPMAYDQALKIYKQISYLNQEHMYRIIPTGASKP